MRNTTFLKEWEIKVDAKVVRGFDFQIMIVLNNSLPSSLVDDNRLMIMTFFLIYII